MATASPELSNVDDETAQFVDDWAQIMQISKKVNQALTMQQKAVLVLKIIELVFAEGQISERQGNLIFYIGEALKIPLKDLQAMRAFVHGQDIEELMQKNIMIIDEGSDGIQHPGPRIVAKNLTGRISKPTLSSTSALPPSPSMAYPSRAVRSMSFLPGARSGATRLSRFTTAMLSGNSWWKNIKRKSRSTRSMYFFILEPGGRAFKISISRNTVEN
jgi:hypothetical protein